MKKKEFRENIKKLKKEKKELEAVFLKVLGKYFLLLEENKDLREKIAQLQGKWNM